MDSPLNVSYAVFFRFALQFLCLKMCVYGGSTVPQGGGGVTWQPSPRGWRTVFPGVGQDGGGGGANLHAYTRWPHKSLGCTERCAIKAHTEIST